MPVLTDADGRVVVTTMGHGSRVGHRHSGLARFSQFVDYGFWLLYALLGIRLLLVFFQAYSGAGFVGFIDAVTNPFYGPFRGIVRNQDINGQYTIAVPILVTMVVYGILHLAINKLLRVIAYRRANV